MLRVNPRSTSWSWTKKVFLCSTSKRPTSGLRKTPATGQSSAFAVSSTFSVRPGTQINANYTVDIAQDLIWGSNSQSRRGTTFVNSTATTVSQNLLSNDTYGERITLVDMKFAKNVRFSGKRVNIGVDVYNIFNSDAALAYCTTFPNPARGIDGCGSAANGNLRQWNEVDEIVAPRYARFQIGFDF
jgi:hypothetical protein